MPRSSVTRLPFPRLSACSSPQSKRVPLFPSHNSSMHTPAWHPTSGHPPTTSVVTTPDSGHHTTHTPSFCAASALPTCFLAIVHALTGTQARSPFSAACPAAPTVPASPRPATTHACRRQGRRGRRPPGRRPAGPAAAAAPRPRLHPPALPRPLLLLATPRARGPDSLAAAGSAPVEWRRPGITRGRWGGRFQEDISGTVSGML